MNTVGITYIRIRTVVAADRIRRLGGDGWRCAGRYASSTVLVHERGREDNVKGKEWYQADDVAQEYDSKRFSRGGRLIDDREKRAVLEALGPVDGKDILEIACGTGRFTALLAERGANIVGLDISAAMLAQGREKARNAGVADHIEFLRGDAARLPFPDDHFDVVFAMRFFHLAETPAKFITEMARVSKDLVFFDTFNERSTRVAYNWLLPMGSHLYSADQVGRLLDDAGLRLVNDEHDFLLPYGFYRKIPNSVAQQFRDIDTSLGEAAVGPWDVGDALASVSYWTATVDGADQ
ncbi:Methyltransferase domain-containing protein [Halobellus clavatus]|uniref:Methyltransferase domain-containing protein n=1 Tax=Halobellus clavatus TaxID=660517 RepID=A0A1H3CQF9_9EURY|nr:Methyltransferase domain-containing protein [Halobellus clavatus]